MSNFRCDEATQLVSSDWEGCMRGLLVLLALGAGTSGCATIEVNGITTSETQWHKDEAEIRRRASFEMHCPAADLQLTLLKTSGFAPPIPWTIGVQGCGHEGVYQVVYGTGWVLNSASK